MTPWLLAGDEALPLQALEHRKRRGQWFTARAVMPAPVRDTIDPARVGRLVVSRKAHLRIIFDEYRRACFISVYGELIRRLLPQASAFHRLIAADGSLAWRPRPKLCIPSWKETLALLSQR